MNTQCCFQKSLKWQRCHFDAQSSEVFFQKKKNPDEFNFQRFSAHLLTIFLCFFLEDMSLLWLKESWTFPLDSFLCKHERTRVDKFSDKVLQMYSIEFRSKKKEKKERKCQCFICHCNTDAWASVYNFSSLSSYRSLELLKVLTLR